jgi:hypothetical protein
MTTSLFFLRKKNIIKKKKIHQAEGAKPNPATTQKTYIQPKKGKANPTRLNPVKDPNVKQSKTHQTQFSKSNAGPKTKLQKRDV